MKGTTMKETTMKETAEMFHGAAKESYRLGDVSGAMLLFQHCNMTIAADRDGAQGEPVMAGFFELRDLAPWLLGDEVATVDVCEDTFCYLHLPYPAYKEDAPLPEGFYRVYTRCGFVFFARVY